jgi:serine/threonine protein phosphatase 1
MPLAPPRPARRTYAVGDIHGCLDALETMLSLIAVDAGGMAHDLVFLGDYVDRGPDSAGVLDRLMALARGRDDVHCLAGNHDRMLLDAVAEPDSAPAWLSMGGDATLASLGCLPERPAAGGAAARNAARAAALQAALGPERQAWLAGLPLWWQSGNLIAVHGLTDPCKDMSEQDPEHLVWARPGPDLAPRADGAWVVHGHTIVPEPTVRAGHVAVDTGAFAGNPLTAAVFTPDGAPPRFLQTPRSGAW